jgi:hypothetical protein
VGVRAHGGIDEGAGIGDDEALVAPVVAAAQGRVDGQLGTEASVEQVVAAEAAQQLVELGAVEAVEPGGVDDVVGGEAAEAQLPVVGRAGRWCTAVRARERPWRRATTRPPADRTVPARAVRVANTPVVSTDRASQWAWAPATTRARRRPARSPS